MKMVVGYIDREMFEPIREELLDLGFLSISVMDAAGSMPEPVTTASTAASPWSATSGPKARLEAVVGDEHAQTVVDTITKQGERTFTVVLPVEAAFPLATVKEGDEATCPRPTAAPSVDGRAGRAGGLRGGGSARAWGRTPAQWGPARGRGERGSQLQRRGTASHDEIASRRERHRARGGGRPHGDHGQEHGRGGAEGQGQGRERRARRPAEQAVLDGQARPERRVRALAGAARCRRRTDAGRSARCASGSRWTTSTGSCTARTTRCAASASKIEVWVANDIAFPAGDCRAQIPDSTTVTDAQVARPDRAVRHEHVPEGDGGLLHAAGPRRDQLADPPDANGNGGDYTGGGDKTVTLIDNVRDDNYYDFPAAPTYIAGFFSSQFNDLRRPQRHDDRRVRLGAPHRRQPAGRADRRPVHQPPGAAEPLRGHVRARVAAPAAPLHRPVRDDLDERGPVRLRADPDRVRRRAPDGVRPRRRQPHLLLPGLRHRADAVQPEPARLRRARRTR